MTSPAGVTRARGREAPRRSDKRYNVSGVAVSLDPDTIDGQLASIRRGKLRMGDAMQIDVGAPSEAARPGSSVLGKRAAYGSDGERWAERMLRTTITDDIARGCSKACGCVDAHALAQCACRQRHPGVALTRIHGDGLWHL